MKFKIIALVLLICLVVGAAMVACGPAKESTPTPTATTAPKPTTPAKPEVVNLLFGAAPTSSGVYIPCAGQGKVFNQYVPGIQVTVVESGAPAHNIANVQAGYLDFGVGSVQATYLAYYGLERYAGKAWKDVRLMYDWGPMYVHYVVREDSGITNLTGLNGKKFHPSTTGSTAEYVTKQMFDALGIKPDYLVAGFADATAAMKDGRIVGVAKSSGTAVLDSMLLDIKSQIPVRFLSFTEEQKAIASKAVPFVAFQKLEKGDVKNSPDVGPVLSWLDSFNAFATTKMSEEVVYKLVKGIMEHWKTDFAPIYPDAEWYDPIQATLSDAESYEKVVPLHPGAIKYYKEKGYKVPDKYLPPEYK